MIRRIKTFIARHYSILRQIIYFGLVGVCAAITQMLIVILLVEYCHLHPLEANIFGFLIAFNVSYFGHRNFTFAGTKTIHSTAVKRLLVIASLGFIANESLFYVFLNIYQLYYPLALFITLLIFPFITFLLSKFWVFGSKTTLSAR